MRGVHREAVDCFTMLQEVVDTKIESEILSALARLRRKVMDILFAEPRAALADSLPSPLRFDATSCRGYCLSPLRGFELVCGRIYSNSSYSVAADVSQRYLFLMQKEKD
jgi:hypothetical protein